MFELKRIAKYLAIGMVVAIMTIMFVFLCITRTNADSSFSSDVNTLPEENVSLTEPNLNTDDAVQNTEPEVTEAEDAYLETVCETQASQRVFQTVPKYNQRDYNDPFGAYGSVSSHGCGITCIAMIASYLKDEPEYTPDVLAAKFGEYNTSCGTEWSLFPESAEDLDLGKVTQVFKWPPVEEALRRGCLVISNQIGGIFTSTGHYILLTGITEDGKVMVNDPNGRNWDRFEYEFENGFEPNKVYQNSAVYWIYEYSEESTDFR